MSWRGGVAANKRVKLMAAMAAMPAACILTNDGSEPVTS